MTASRRLWLGALASGVMGAGLYFGKTDMGWMTSSKRDDLVRLLGAQGEALVGDAAIAAWVPDPNYKPRSYHLVRALDEAAFRRLAGQAGLAVAASPAVVEGVWRLPDGVTLPGWAAPDVPPGAGLQVHGPVGSTQLWWRWHQGQAFMVVRPAAG